MNSNQESSAPEKRTLKDEERQQCEVWTRIMGYYRPKDSANIGKQGEFNDRKYFKEPKCDKDS